MVYGENAGGNPDLYDEAIRTTAISVTDTATPLVAVPLPNRIGLLIQNLGPANIFIGGTTVAAGSGVLVKADAAGNSTFSDDHFGPHVIPYAITATGTADVRVMELA